MDFSELDKSGDIVLLASWSVLSCWELNSPSCTYPSLTL